MPTGNETEGSYPVWNRKQNGMEAFKVGQGAILTVGTTLITMGAVQLSNRDTFGIVVILVGAALVFWREYRKN